MDNIRTTNDDFEMYAFLCYRAALYHEKYEYYMFVLFLNLLGHIMLNPRFTNRKLIIEYIETMFNGYRGGKIYYIKTWK